MFNPFSVNIIGHKSEPLINEKRLTKIVFWINIVEGKIIKNNNSNIILLNGLLFNHYGEFTKRSHADTYT